MEKGVIVILLLGILLVSPLVLAQEQAQTYSGFSRFIDNVKLVFSSGDSKVRLALEIREKEVYAAITNAQNKGEDKALKNLERAKERLQIVQEKVSLNTSEEIKTSVNEIIEKVNEEENLPDEFEDYILEEEKTHLTAELTEKTYEYCKELAKEDFALMLKEKECNPDTAPEGLEEELKKLKDLQLRMFVQLMLEIRSCIGDPGTCNCEANVDVEQKAKCEKMVALAMKCEYKEDETSCNELKAMEPKQGDNFAESFVPDYLKNLFKEKSYMIEYGMQPSDGVPEECWDENDKPECKQYDHLKETKEDWDKYGNFIGTRPKNKEPTMQEGIPQCFDENNNFLEEKCGKIKIVRNEEGLVNYLIEKEIENVINDFENKSAQHSYAPGTYANDTMNINRTKMQIYEDNWTIDEGEWTVSNKAKEIKKEINQINNQIKERTFAPGTYDTGDSTNDVGDIVVKEGKGSGDNGLTPEINNEMGNGNNELKPEVETEVNSEGNTGNNVVDEVMDEDSSNNVDEDNVVSGGTSGDTGNDNVDDGVDPGPDGIVGVIKETEPGNED